ncbi:MAG: putative nucleotidyltransferase [uncultured marine phage]|uniref:Putative nucleotidyltransferase n=1 Tax=uncultured marine phage TaxID=707152 RepID=A0A8D9C9T7_9VIRU|nr:MAG: putative nucleotidyltransferase [uncultured marine phage]
MKRVVDIETLHIVANDWNPPFKYIEDLDECADIINVPHEDYPDFVDNTKASIEFIIESLKENPALVERDIKAIHNYCFGGYSGKSMKYIPTGEYRNGTVTVGDSFEACQPYLIFPFMMSIFPIEVGMGEDKLKEWYKIFETIHPFEDGNGRVGGIIIAAMSYMETGKYLVSRR